jgi:hypothetical protein
LLERYSVEAKTSQSRASWSEIGKKKQDGIASRNEKNSKNKRRGAR